MQIVIASDHAGIQLKSALCEEITHLGHEAVDFGPDTSTSVDYPDYGKKVAEAISNGLYQRGILICGTGIGMSIVANKFANVRAALCHEPLSAKLSRLHNDANILVLGGRIIGLEMAKEILKVWLETPFEGGRHSLRLQKICNIEDFINKVRDKDVK